MRLTNRSVRNKYRRSQTRVSLTVSQLMARISRLRVSGFKGLDQMEVEPSAINVITGRNNVGKTSLLESIDLAFNPEEITNFKNNLDKVVNVDSSESNISVQFSPEQKSLFADYSKDHPDLKKQEITLREPNEEETIKIFSETLYEIVEMNEDYPIRSHIIPTGDEYLDFENLEDEMVDILNDTVSSLEPESYLDDAKSNILILEVENDEYPYINLSGFYEEVRDSIISICIRKLIQELPENDISLEDKDQEDAFRRRVAHVFKDQLVPRFGSDRFVKDSPPTTDFVQMINSPSIDPESVDTSKENVAIRMSDVEDYLESNGIVENLVDFSFQRLVFRKDGNKKYEVPYSFMGDGFQTIVGILWEVLDESQRGDILLLEEPDIHMHPGYVENLLTQLATIVRENNLQLFITTHNLDLIEGFFSDPIKEAEGDFLRDNFQIIQMTEPVPRFLTYETAEEEIEELNIDLRGI